MPEIVTIATGPVEVLGDRIAAEKLIRGNPATGVRAGLEDEAGGFYTGVWEAEPGAWRVSYDENELCVILAGRVRLTEDGGVPREFGPGETFVIPKGFVGVWETLEHCRKVYAISL